MADATKARGELMDWTELGVVGGTPTQESSVFNSGENKDTDVSSILNVVMAHADGNDAGSNYAGFKVLGRVNADDEGWRDIAHYQATGGTATVGDVDVESATGQANVKLTSTTEYETPGACYFAKNEGALTDSFLVYNKTFANDDYTTMIDNLPVTLAVDDNLYNIVDQWQVRIPFEYSEAKVLFYNTDGDATYAVRVDYVQVTDME